LNPQDLVYALLLPVPPWLGFLIYRYRGKVGISYGYFLGGILAVLSLPWPQLGKGLPSPHLGGALLGFTLFITAHREGGRGLQRLAYGVGGATLFVWITGVRLGLDMRSVLAFWAMALLEGGSWLLLSDLGYRLTQGRWLAVRMPVTGGAATLLATSVFRNLPLGASPLSWFASTLGGVLLGLVALQQLSWLRRQGIWVEGRGDGLRVAMSAIERARPPEGPALAYAIDARQPMFLVNEKGMLMESNNPFSRLVGLQRHQLRGHLLDNLFQGREAPAWEVLKESLQREQKGSTRATLVRNDASFRNVHLEAVAFDRNLALVWIADPAPGSLALRGDRDAAGETPVLGTLDASQLAENALGTILPAVEQILADTWSARTRDAAERIMMAAQRLRPEGARPGMGPALPRIQAGAALDALMPRLRQMLPEEIRAAHRTQDLTLFVESEALERIATHMLLHGRQALERGTVTLATSAVNLGSHAWARMTLELEGRKVPRNGGWSRKEDAAARADQGMSGLTWLQDTVRASLGILAIDRDDSGRLWPRIFLPCQDPAPDPAAQWLAGREIWIQDRDPQVREALCALVRAAGGRAAAFRDLRPLLHAMRGVLPEILVLERTGTLERFQGRLGRIRRRSAPAVLLLEGGRAPAQGRGTSCPSAPGRLIPLEKPFPGQNFLQCLLALLHDGNAARASGQPQEPPCPPSP
jgi:hypothetical protein